MPKLLRKLPQRGPAMLPNAVPPSGLRFVKGIEKMDLTAFDDPSRIIPRRHFGAESISRAGVKLDGLPETRSDRYRSAVEKWIEATGEILG